MITGVSVNPVYSLEPDLGQDSIYYLVHICTSLTGDP